MGIQLMLIFSSGLAMGRSFLLDEASAEFVQSAVMYRQPNVPVAEASMIAAQIVDGALAPPQVTSLFNDASRAFLEYGTNIPPAEALELIQRASGVYAQLRQSPGFANYLNYVSQNANNFNFYAMRHNSQASGLQARLINALQRLEQTAAGQQAVNSAVALVDQIERDAGIHEYGPMAPPPPPPPQPRPVPGRPQPYPQPQPIAYPYPPPR